VVRREEEERQQGHAAGANEGAKDGGAVPDGVQGRSLRPLLRVRWPLHLLRGVLGITMMAAFVYALQTLPLSTAYAIFFVAPLLITALSVPLLRERVGPRRWTAIAVGLVGVLVLLRPTGEGMLSLASLAVLLAALMYAISAISVRVLARTDSTQSMMVWLLTMMALGAGALAIPGWVDIRASDGWIILGVGIAGAFGQYAITEAFRRGEASLIAPLRFRQTRLDAHELEVLDGLRLAVL